MVSIIQLNSDERKKVNHKNEQYEKKKIIKNTEKAQTICTDKI